MTGAEARTGDDGLTARLEARAGRERLARKEAERLLEQKSRELYRANQALREAAATEARNAQQLRAILASLPTAVLIATSGGALRWINESAASMLGIAPDALAGAAMSLLLPALDVARCAAAIGEAGISDPFISTARRLDGSEFPVEVALTVTSGADDPATIWMIRDITQRTLQELRQREAEEQRTRTQRLEALGTLAGGIAHELNTPIQFLSDNMDFLDAAFAGIAGAVGELAARCPPEDRAAIERRFDIRYLFDEVPKAVAQSRDGLQRVTEIVRATRRFLHPAGPTLEPNDLNEIVRTAVLLSRNQWRYVADLTTELQPGLQPARSSAGELVQVLVNLIVNAAQAIEDRGPGPAGRIAISTRAVDGGVECSVADNGIGILPEHRERIFDLFFTTKAPGRGTGQGLALVHSIVTRAHGGQVSCDSEIGRGTTFRFTLPAD